jgi:hypothetical protein
LLVVWNSLSAATKEHLELYWKALKTELNACHHQELKPLMLTLYGGTNTGKSTIFNLILNGDVSPAKVIASATKQPIISISSNFRDLASTDRFDQFNRLSSSKEALISPLSLESMSVYYHVHQTEDCLLGDIDPEGYLGIIDTPDHDSSNILNHQVARLMLDHTDLCLYITTAQKYKMLSTVDTLNELLARGLTVGVLFNQLDNTQDLQAMWQDLTQILNHSNVPNQASEQRSSILLLGGLPLIKSAEEKVLLKPQVQSSLNILLEGLSPQDYMLDKSYQRIKIRGIEFKQAIEHLYTERAQTLASVYHRFDELIEEERTTYVLSKDLSFFTHIKRAHDRINVEQILSQGWLRRTLVKVSVWPATQNIVGLWEQRLIYLLSHIWSKLLDHELNTQSLIMIDLTHCQERLHQQEREWSRTVYLSLLQRLNAPEVTVEDASERLTTLTNKIDQSKSSLYELVLNHQHSQSTVKLDLSCLLLAGVMLWISEDILIALCFGCLCSFLLTILSIFFQIKQSVSTEKVSINHIGICKALIDRHAIYWSETIKESTSTLSELSTLSTELNQLITKEIGDD